LSRYDWSGSKEREENAVRAIVDQRDIADIMTAEFSKLWSDLNPYDREKRYVFDFLHKLKRDIDNGS
jgi:hypothetical protein